MGWDRQLTGYCTNVHAGADLTQTRANLEHFALEVKRQVSPEQAMGLGLWLTAAAAREMRVRNQVGPFADWLASVGLVPFTFNGFPYGDFHQKVVKRQVYLPTWADAERLDYTLDLLAIQDRLLPPGREGSISTLPIAWGTPMPDTELLRAASRNLVRAAEALARLEDESGRLIYLCLEPEPGCVLQRQADLPWFFREYVWPNGNEAMLRRYLRVCHDVCHSVVMFEPQEQVLRTYAAAGLLVGKVQVSSAIRIDFAPLSQGERVEAVGQLAAFAEDRYLHQTSVRSPGESSVLHEDLPGLLRSIADPRTLNDEWRIHFHVPIHLDRFGHLCSSRADIVDCLRACAQHSAVRHFEVETYAWSVLPIDRRPANLADGIAAEMAWFWQQPAVTSAPGDRP